MNASNWAKRLAHPGPLYPYSWEARYRGGGRLRQFDVDGYHTSRDIDLARIEALVIVGHPNGPITLVLPESRQPDQVVLMSEVSLVQTGGEMHREASRFFGFRYGSDRYLVEIDDHGRVFKTNNVPSLAGAGTRG